MALGDFMAAQQQCEERIVSRLHLGGSQAASLVLEEGIRGIQDGQNMEASIHHNTGRHDQNSNSTFLPSTVYFGDVHRGAYEDSSSAGPAENGLVSKIRMKDRMKTGYVALVLCLNIGVDPPDVIKITPCARMECWIDPFSMSAQKAIDAIGEKLRAQYMLWQPKTKYKLQVDPTLDDIKKLCTHCRKSARTERVLFHYNGHGVPKPTVNGEIWLFNKTYTQYIPLSVYELESWLGTPSIYVLDCSAAGLIVNAFCERPEWGLGGSVASAMKDCILLAACGSHESLPQLAELPADLFTSCLTTPITIALRWFCKRSLLRDSLDPDLIDKIPGRQNDRRTPLGELNWIFTAITDTIAWNVLPRELFQWLFRQDLLVASLFRNFLLAERIMRAANCCPQSYPRLPATHQHHMWHAWDMAAEICLSQLPKLLNDSAEFQPSPFFTEQLTAFEIWLEHGSERKKPPEQLPIVLQVLLSQSHRLRALVLLGKFLDMGAWAVDLALSVGIFPYVLKLLQTTAVELRQILVFIWTKILALDKSCQVDLVKDGGHQYFIRFLDTADIYPEQRAMAAFVLAVIVDGHRKGQEECMQCGLINICLKHVELCIKMDGQSEPLLLQWLCLCLGKMWDGFSKAQQQGLQLSAASLLQQLLSEPQPQIRATATFALGTLISGNEGAHDDAVSDNSSVDGCDEEDERLKAEREVACILLTVLYDGSPLVRAELAIGLSRFAISHNKQLKAMAATCMKAPSTSMLTSLSGGISATCSSSGSITDIGHMNVASTSMNVNQTQHSRVNSDSAIPVRVNLSGSPGLSLASDILLHPPEGSDVLGNGSVTNGTVRPRKQVRDESGCYFRCVSAIYTLARDPSPQVACHGQQVLRFIGLEPSTRTSMIGCQTTGQSVNHHRKASLGAVPSPVLSGIPRSFSWIDSSSGNIGATFCTPPASPPTAPNMLVGSGMRRVCSLEFSPHMRKSSDSGLADTVLVGGGPFGSVSLPSSNLYRWSCCHFSRPLLEPSHDDHDEEAAARKVERERMAIDGISKCQHSNVTRVSEQIASWDIDCQNSVQAVLLHPFLPLVLSFDENEIIRVWDYEEGVEVNVYENHNALHKGVSRMCLLNELDDSLLLLVSSDGSARVWKDYTQKNKQHLVTAWQTTAGLRSGHKTLVDWQQLTGYLFSSGAKSSINVWDLNQEFLTFNIQTHTDSPFSSLTASQGLCLYVAAGFYDGSVKIFDIRSRDIVYTSSLHKQMVVNTEFLPGIEPNKIVSASAAGDMKFFDLRKAALPYLEVEAHKNSLSAMAAHRYAPFIATGTSKQYIKVFSLQGEQLSVIRYHNSFLGQRIGPVSALAFHTYKVYLAAGATDSNVSIYSGDSGIA